MASPREVAERFLEALRQNDVEAVCATVHPEAELVPATGLRSPEAPYRGHEGVREWLDQAALRLTDIALEVHELQEHGCHVLMRARLTATGRRGSLPPTDAYWMFRTREGRVVRLVGGVPRAAALDEMRGAAR